MQHYNDQKPVLASFSITEMVSPGKIAGTPSILNQYRINQVEHGNQTFVSPSPSRLMRKKGNSLKNSNDRKNLPLNELDSVKKTLRFENYHSTITSLYSPQRSNQTSSEDKNGPSEKPNILKFR
jgi:hypothetical protein